MVISHSHKFIFIHLPKNAGTSMFHLLQKYTDAKRNNRHSGAITSKKIVGDKIWNEYFKFAVVRNPLSRLYSWFNHNTKAEEEKNIWNFRKYNKTFKDFIYNPIKSNMGKGRDPFDYAQTQYDFLSDDNGFNINFILFYENIQKDWFELCQKIQIPYEGLPKLNKAKSLDTNYKDIYTPEMIKIIKERLKKDFDYFKYGV